jgi:hypothetical protein
MIEKTKGTIYLKSGFHYSGTVEQINSEWIQFRDSRIYKKTKKNLSIRIDSIDHFIPLGDDF